MHAEINRIGKAFDKRAAHRTLVLNDANFGSMNQLCSDVLQTYVLEA